MKTVLLLFALLFVQHNCYSQDNNNKTKLINSITDNLIIYDNHHGDYNVQNIIWNLVKQNISARTNIYREQNEESSKLYYQSLKIGESLISNQIFLNDFYRDHRVWFKKWIDSCLITDNIKIIGFDCNTPNYYLIRYLIDSTKKCVKKNFKKQIQINPEILNLSGYNVQLSKLDSVGYFSIKNNIDSIKQFLKKDSFLLKAWDNIENFCTWLYRRPTLLEWDINSCFEVPRFFMLRDSFMAINLRKEYYENVRSIIITGASHCERKALLFNHLDIHDIPYSFSDYIGDILKTYTRIFVGSHKDVKLVKIKKYLDVKTMQLNGLSVMVYSLKKNLIKDYFFLYKYFLPEKNIFKFL